jgi:erythromycin esterase
MGSSDVLARGVVDWIANRATPLSETTPWADAGVRAIVGRAQIVGVGDATHGTKEFFDVRLGLLRFLVTEMGFNILALEASYSATEALNTYVLHGEGDRDAVIGGLGLLMWDVEEFVEVVNWLAEYNSASSEADKVRICGLDSWNSQAGATRVVAYLRRVAADEARAAGALFRDLRLGYAEGMLRAHEHLQPSTLRSLHHLLAFFADRRAELIARSSPAEYESAARDAAVVSQWVGINLTDRVEGELLPPVPRRAGLNNLARSWYMADNLTHLVHRRPGAKVIAWAHMYHLGLRHRDRVHGEVPNMGSRLKQAFGDRFAVLGLELGRGAFLTRQVLADGARRDLVVATAPPAPKGSLPWYLSHTALPRFVLDVRAASPTPPIRRWLARPRAVHMVSWLHTDPPQLYARASVRELCDAVVFINNTSATTPTVHARTAARAQTGH